VWSVCVEANPSRYFCVEAKPSRYFCVEANPSRYFCVEANPSRYFFVYISITAGHSIIKRGRLEITVAGLTPSHVCTCLKSVSHPI